MPCAFDCSFPVEPSALRSLVPLLGLAPAHNPPGAVPVLSRWGVSRDAVSSIKTSHAASTTAQHASRCASHGIFFLASTAGLYPCGLTGLNAPWTGALTSPSFPFPFVFFLPRRGFGARLLFGKRRDELPEPRLIPKLLELPLEARAHGRFFGGGLLRGGNSGSAWWLPLLRSHAAVTCVW